MYQQGSSLILKMYILDYVMAQGTNTRGKSKRVMTHPTMPSPKAILATVTNAIKVALTQVSTSQFHRKM